ncbi:hypothetical protein BKA82DRAFT_4011284 [Pisolithus tinctorius]|nr:hypothetical protein BKA82DRAFT_4011284 [Pisolithus tinctorius]
MPSFACSTCGETLSNKKDYNLHIKKCSPRTTIHLPHTKQVLALERNLEGDFICYCSHSGCPRPFKYANSLRAHILKAGTTWIGDNTKGSTSTGKLDFTHGQGPESQPSKAKRSLEHAKENEFVPGAGPSMSRAIMDLEDHDSIEDYTNEISHDLGSIPSPPQTHGWLVQQDHIMRSPTPPEPPTNTTVTPQGSPSVQTHLDIHMVSPRSERLGPSPNLPTAPLPSLMSVIQSHNEPRNMATTSAETATHTLPGPTSGLYHHPYLDSLDLAVNAEFHFLTCQICQVALATEEVRSHLTRVHGRPHAYNDGQFQLAIKSLATVAGLPATITGPRSLVHGLKVHNGLACNHCPFLSRSEERLRKHHSKDHPSIPRPRAWRACQIQHLKESSGDLQVFWEVENAGVDTQQTLQEDLVNSFLKELEPMLEVIQTPLDGRMVNPWLLTTRWHEHVAGQNIRQLCSLVSLPKAKDGDIPAELRDAVDAYYQQALSLLNCTEELVLQRLNSPDPTKSGISNTPLHKHLHQETMKQYTVPVVALLAMLIRQEYSGQPFSGSNSKLMELLAVLRIDPEATEEALPLIHALLFEIWSTAWQHQGSKEIVDPTERCLALLTLREDGAFKEPHEVTTKIAKFEYCMRLTFLQEIHHRTQSEPQRDQLEHCLDMENFFVEKTHYTFSRLRSLQHRASALAYDTMSLPQVWWTDTKTWQTMLYRGEEVRFADLCKVFQEVEAKLVQVWEQDILMGQDIRVGYDKMADDLVNKDRFLEDEGTFAHFAMIRNGAIIWNQSSLQAWLKKYAEMQGLLLLRAQMLSGAPSRGTELTAMTYRNTQTRPTCNLVILGRHVTLLCQYLKTTALTGKDKLIPHALDGITSDILVQDLALARPFAEIAAKACFPDKPEVVELYRNHVFVNYDRLFDSENLSVEDIMDMDREDNIEALQAGHSRSTENQVYGISVETLAGAAEDILPAYLNASMEWQKHCHRSKGQWQMQWFPDYLMQYPESGADSGK